MQGRVVGGVRALCPHVARPVLFAAGREHLPQKFEKVLISRQDVVNQECLYSIIGETLLRHFVN